MKTLIKVLIILSMIIGGISIVPIIVGIIAINKINKAKSKEELTLIGILTLLLCNPLAGILMFFIKFDDKAEKQTNDFGEATTTDLKKNKYEIIEYVETFLYLPLLLVFISFLLSQSLYLKSGVSYYYEPLLNMFSFLPRVGVRNLCYSDFIKLIVIAIFTVGTMLLIFLRKKKNIVNKYLSIITFVLCIETIAAFITSFIKIII